MVKLHTSLFAVTLATGSALASSNDYQRFQRRSEQGVVPNLQLRFGLACARHNNLQSRGFVDEEELFVRDDSFDDLEAREPLNFKTAGKVASLGTKAYNHPNTQHALTALNYGSQAYGLYETLKSRGLEDDEDLFVRDLDAFDDLEAREPLNFKTAGKVVSLGTKAANHPNTQHALTALNYGSQAYGLYETLKSRGLEDDEDLFVRDVDAFDDLEAREPFNFNFKSAGTAIKYGKKFFEHKNTKKALKGAEHAQDVYGAYESLKSRGLEDDEDLFVRDLDTEELFGREYDLLDERDIIDDLD